MYTLWCFLVSGYCFMKVGDKWCSHPSYLPSGTLLPVQDWRFQWCSDQWWGQGRWRVMCTGPGGWRAPSGRRWASWRMVPTTKTIVMNWSQWSIMTLLSIKFSNKYTVFLLKTTEPFINVLTMKFSKLYYWCVEQSLATIHSINLSTAYEAMIILVLKELICYAGEMSQVTWWFFGKTSMSASCPDSSCHTSWTLYGCTSVIENSRTCKREKIP